MPKHLEIARRLVGTKEFPGAPSNPKIMGWANRVGAKVLGIPYAGDHVPWCGLGVAYCMVEAGHQPPRIAIRAKSWATWGQALGSPVPGAVLVFDRAGGGHVGFYVGEDKTHYHVLGFNQSDGVNTMRLEKKRLVAHGIRWPSGLMVEGYRVRLAADGAPASVNEA